MIYLRMLMIPVVVFSGAYLGIEVVDNAPTAWVVGVFVGFLGALIAKGGE